MAARDKKTHSKKPVQSATRIFGHLKPYLPTFLSGFIFLIISSLTAMLFPLLLGKLIGREEAGMPSADLLALDTTGQIITALVIVFALQALFSFFRILLFARVTENTLCDIRESAFRSLVSAPVNFFHRHKVGELTSRIAADINLLQTTFNTTIAEFVRQTITIIIGIAALFWLSPKLSMIMLAIVPIVAILAVVFGRYIRGLSKKTQSAAAESNNILEETLQGIQNVKAFTNEFFEMRRFGKAINEVKSLGIKNAFWRGLFVSFIIVCMFGSIVFVIWQGVMLTQDGTMVQADFIAFILYTIFLGASIGSLPDLYASIQKALGATDHLMEIIATGKEVEDISAPPVTGEKFSGRISFKNVQFAYESRRETLVLSDLSFDLEAGRQLAIVGPSGAGKSTIVSLLLRFYEPQTGEILVDGQNIQQLDLRGYRSQIAIVPQEVLLFNGSIRENIAYGAPGATEAEIREAAEQANAREFIESFPEKFDTLVGERGVQLSGGQRQRIAIARAVLKNPSILILDEATSSLDSESEHLVQQALDKLMQDRTTIVIAHRLSTIRQANKIIVLEHGRIVESGTHNELVHNDHGIYQKLLERQNLYAVNN